MDVRNRISQKLIVDLGNAFTSLGRYIVVNLETGQVIQTGFRTRKEAQEDFPESVNAMTGE